MLWGAAKRVICGICVVVSLFLGVVHVSWGLPVTGTGAGTGGTGAGAGTDRSRWGYRCRYRPVPVPVPVPVPTGPGTGSVNQGPSQYDSYFSYRTGDLWRAGPRGGRVLRHAARAPTARQPLQTRRGTLTTPRKTHSPARSRGLSRYMWRIQTPPTCSTLSAPCPQSCRQLRRAAAAPAVVSATPPCRCRPRKE